MQAADKESTNRTVTGPHMGTYRPWTVPRAASIRVAPACPSSLRSLNPRSRGRSKKGPTSSGCSGAPARWFHSFPRLSTPPRNTTSLHGPMLVHLRNKTQKQIKRQFLFKQERGQASGVPGRRPLVPTPGGHFPPSALAVLKPRPPCGLHQP